jgi:predicted nuclease with TOPRIM domain
MEALTRGAFTLSWHLVATNMTVGADNLVKVFQESKNLREFRNAVTNLKPPKKADENGAEKTKPKSRRELENEIARLREILQVKDQQIEELTAEIYELKEKIEQIDEIGIEDDNINMTDPVAA